MEWLHEQAMKHLEGSVSHVVGGILIAIASIAISMFIHWYRTTRYGKLVRVEMTKLEKDENGKFQYRRKVLLVKPALELLFRRKWAAQLVSAANKTIDGCWMSTGSWTVPVAKKILDASCDQLQQFFPDGNVAWGVDDSDVTEKDFIVGAFRNGDEILILLLRPDHLATYFGQSIPEEEKFDLGRDPYGTGRYCKQLMDLGVNLLNVQRHVCLSTVKLCM
jgi:hypothetical protein